MLRPIYNSVNKKNLLGFSFQRGVYRTMYFKNDQGNIPTLRFCKILLEHNLKPANLSHNKNDITTLGGIKDT